MAKNRKRDQKSKGLEKTGSKEEEEKELEAEILEQLPDEAKDKFLRFVKESSFMISGPAPNPLYKKLTSEHLTSIIENVEKTDIRKYEYARSNRWHDLIKIGVAVMLLLVIFFALIDKDRSLLIELFKYGLAAIAGFSGGYGYRVYHEKRKF